MEEEIRYFSGPATACPQYSRSLTFASSHNAIQASSCVRATPVSRKHSCLQ